MQSDEFDGQIKSLLAGTPLWSLSGLFELENLGKVNGDLRLDEAAFEFRYAGTSAKLENGGGFLHLHGDRADFVFTGASGGGSLTIQGQFVESFKQFSIRANIVSFPTLPIAHVLASRGLLDKEKLLAILGPTTNLDGAASYDKEKKGLIDIALHTPNINGEFHGLLSNDAITLKQALTATFHLTPELGQTLLADASPLFVTSISAEKPIYLRVEPSNFRWQLPLRFDQLQIGQATLDVGKVICKNGGTLSLLISILKKDYFGTRQQMEVWFSPLSFQLHEGILQAGRMDALAAGSVHICSWGNINLEKSKLDMNLGLTAETLQDSFGIRNLSDDYVLKIPLTGTLSHPKLATSTAVAKVAALLAGQKTAKRLPGGILGLFAETQSDIPPPNRPFPWEK